MFQTWKEKPMNLGSKPLVMNYSMLVFYYFHSHLIASFRVVTVSFLFILMLTREREENGLFITQVPYVL